MAVACRQIHQPPLGQQINGFAVGQQEALDIVPYFAAFLRQSAQPGHVHLHVEVARVAQDSALLHFQHMLGADHAVAAGHGDEPVAYLGRLRHGQHGKAVHHCLDGLHRVDLGHNDLRAQPLGPHGHALAAPAVPGHHDGGARHHQIGGAHHAVPHALAGAVAVIEQVLAVRVVDIEHGEPQLTRLGPVAQANDAGGGLLAAAPQVDRPLGMLFVQDMHHIAAVVDNDVRLHGQGLALEVMIFFQCAAVGRQHGHAPAGQSGAHIVLRGQRIGAGGVHFAAAFVDHLRQIGGLRFQMNADHHFQPGKWLFFPKLFGNAAQNGHVLFNPVDFLNPLRGQIDIPNHGIHVITSPKISWNILPYLFHVRP